MVVAKALNPKFDTDMRAVFEIPDKDHPTNPTMGVVEYRAGPLKQLLRCQAKAENVREDVLLLALYFYIFVTKLL